MTIRRPPRAGFHGTLRSLVPLALLVLSGSAAGRCLAGEPQAPAPETPKRNIAGPGDYVIREKVVRALSHDGELARERFTFVMVNGGAVFSGEMNSYALKRRLLSITASIRGVINVTDEMTVPRGEATDEALAKAVTSRLSDAAEDLGLRDLDVRVEEGVLTLKGIVKEFAARGRAEDVAGAVLGVTRISNHLQPAGAPSGADDAALQKAVVAYLGDFRTFNHRADIRVKVAQGIVTLTGKVTLYLARQQAAIAASLVKGVARVDNRIKVDPSFMSDATIVRADE